MKAHEEQELALKNQLSGLVADLVHQMNTPLTNIRMYCDFLKMPDLSAENKNHFLSNISRQAEKLGWFGEEMCIRDRVHCAAFFNGRMP